MSSSYFQFRVGDLRFNKPVLPFCLGPGVNNATSYGNACPQMPLYRPGEEFPNDFPGLAGAETYLNEFLAHGTVADSEDCR